jgi:hypothetical protein
MSMFSPAFAHRASAAGMSGSSLKPYWTMTWAEVAGQPMHFDAVDVRHVRHVEDLNAEDDDLFVQGLVVLEAVQQGVRHDVRVGVMKMAVPGRARCRWRRCPR